LKDGIQTLAASKTPAATGADSAAAVETRPESGEEAGIPLSDREKVADLLQDAGIDPAVPRTFVGKSLEAMQEVLGKPSATLRAQDKVVYIFYNCFEVESIDGGKSVSRVHYMGE